MKKLFIWLALFTLLFSMTGCVANTPETLIPVTQEPYDPVSGEFLTPPKGYVVTQSGNIPLRTGGYSWSVDTIYGTGKHMIADQYMWPLPVKDMETVKIIPESPLDGINYYMTDPPISIPMGAKVTLDWQVMPDSVECVFWPADHETTGATECKMVCEKDGFVAHLGSYIYEITSGWLDHGDGFSSGQSVAGLEGAVAVTGHNTQLNDASNGMVAAGGVEYGALLHQGSVGVGEVDLSKYSKVVVMWGCDNSQVTIDHYNANANNRIMLLNAEMSMVMSPAAETVIAGGTYELKGWAVTAFEIDLTGIDYNGPVFVTYDTLEGTFMLVGEITFIGDIVTEAPEAPETPDAE